MSAIFISHNSKDYQHALAVYEFLRENGFDVFLSEDSLPRLGPEFLKHIAVALESAQDLIVVASTKERISSSFVENEWRVFISEKWSGRKSGGVFSILVERMPVTDLPLELRYYEAIPWTHGGRDRLLRFLGRAVSDGLESSSHGPQRNRTSRPHCLTNHVGATLIEIPAVREREPAYAFYACLTPLSNRHYAAYIAAGGNAPGGDAEQPHLQTWHDGQCPESVLDHPVVNVSHSEARRFCRWLTKEEQESGTISKDERYVLPTFEQWKLLSRPGSVPPNAVMDRLWGQGACQPTEPVYSGPPNRLGLLGIWGNVFEWCSDTKRDQRCDFALAVSGGWSTARAWIEEGHVGVWRPYGRPMKDGGFRICLRSQLSGNRAPSRE